MLKTAVLVSGGGTNLQALIDYQAAQGDSCPYEIVCVISDSKKAFALERAAKAGIPTAICSPYAKYGAEAIVEAGCLTVLAGDILKKYENKIINLHPALLPKFGGVGMFGHHVHEAVIAAGEKESGCTIHIADGGCDTGRILIQKKVPVMPDDTPDTLYARIAPKEHEAIVEGLCLLAKEIK